MHNLLKFNKLERQFLVMFLQRSYLLQQSLLLRVLHSHLLVEQFLDRHPHIVFRHFQFLLARLAASFEVTTQRHLCVILEYLLLRLVKQCAPTHGCPIKL